MTRRYLGDYKQSATAWDETEDGTDTTSLNDKPRRSVRGTDEKWYELPRSRFQSRLEARQT